MDKFYSVEEISEMLQIHSKTIQRYIREGKIIASKFGKSWRVAAHDLSLFIEDAKIYIGGDKPSSKDEVGLDISGSTVIDIPVSSSYEVDRITSQVNAAMNSKPIEYGKSSVSVQYIEPEKIVRVMIWGKIGLLKVMLDMISNLARS